MQLFLNTEHHQHQGRQEMFRGRLVDCHEVPARLDHVAAEWDRRQLGAAQPWGASGDDTRLAIARVHDSAYVRFVQTAWEQWVALHPDNAQRDALPSVWPLPSRHGFRTDAPLSNFAARLGQYAFDSGTPLKQGSWAAAEAGARCAVSAAMAVAAGAPSAFALTRPPGHHAGPDYMGGYCFLNNAAIAAQRLRDQGFERVAVVDVDYHHGNGTQTIFYERGDVFTLSIHGDPRTEYPFFLGHADETGAADGEGSNLNLPLPRGTTFATWHAALQVGLERVMAWRPSALVVPLGVDTFEGDPISGFALQSADYLRVGQTLASLQLPTVFTFEGGYAVAEVGVNAVNVLQGFMQHHRLG